jgi:TPP-dependent 2-oxoacid decarboxylase
VRNLPAIRDEIMLRDTDGEIFAINLEDGEIYQLNETAVKIFNLCQQEITLDEAVAQLAAECTVSGQEGVIREDVEETVSLFRELGFVVDDA